MNDEAKAELVSASEAQKPLIDQTAMSATSNISPLVMLLASGELQSEHLEKALEIQKQHEKYEAEKAFARALANFRKIAPTIKKDRTVDYSTQKGRTHYQHSSLGYTLSQVNPILGQCDLNLSWRPRQENGLVFVATRLTHSAGHFEEIELSSPPDNTGNKNSMQAIGSAITYLERMGAFALLGLASEHDDDGRATTQSAPLETPKISDKQAGEIEDLLIKMDDLEDGFRDRWVGHYSSSWKASDFPPGLEVPPAEFERALHELKTKLKKLENNGDNQ